MNQDLSFFSLSHEQRQSLFEKRLEDLLPIVIKNSSEMDFIYHYHRDHFDYPLSEMMMRYLAYRNDPITASPYEKTSFYTWGEYAIMNRLIQTPEGLEAVTRILREPSSFIDPHIFSSEDYNDLLLLRFSLLYLEKQIKPNSQNYKNDLLPGPALHPTLLKYALFHSSHITPEQQHALCAVPGYLLPSSCFYLMNFDAYPEYLSKFHAHPTTTRTQDIFKSMQSHLLAVRREMSCDQKKKKCAMLEASYSYHVLLAIVHRHSGYFNSVNTPPAQHFLSSQLSAHHIYQQEELMIKDKQNHKTIFKGNQIPQTIYRFHQSFYTSNPLKNTIEPNVFAHYLYSIGCSHLSRLSMQYQKKYATYQKKTIKPELFLSSIDNTIELARFAVSQSADGQAIQQPAQRSLNDFSQTFMAHDFSFLLAHPAIRLHIDQPFKNPHNVIDGRDYPEFLEDKKKVNLTLQAYHEECQIWQAINNNHVLSDQTSPSFSKTKKKKI